MIEEDWMKIERWFEEKEENLDWILEAEQDYHQQHHQHSDDGRRNDPPIRDRRHSSTKEMRMRMRMEMGMGTDDVDVRGGRDGERRAKKKRKRKRKRKRKKGEREEEGKRERERERKRERERENDVDRYVEVKKVSSRLVERGTGIRIGSRGFLRRGESLSLSSQCRLSTVE